MNKIIDFLNNIKIGEPIIFKNMGVFPVYTENGIGLDYLTLDFALQNNLIDITEKDIGGSVPELKVTSKSDHNILLMDGEELVGAKQNRILNTTIIITPYSETIIPVSCVERSRWSYISEKFASGMHSHSTLRGKKAFHVSRSLKREGSYRSDQSDIWNEVTRKSRSLGAESPTQALYDVYQQKQSDLEQYISAFKYVEGCNGVIIAINGKIFCADIFDKSNTMEKLWKKLINSYALDAIEDIKEDRKVSIENAKSFLNEVKKGEFKAYNSVGLGEDVRITAKNIIGSALFAEDKVVHIGLFRTDEPNEPISANMIHASHRRRVRQV